MATTGVELQTRLNRASRTRGYNEVSLPTRLVVNLVFVVLSLAILLPMWLAVSISISNETEMFTQGYSLLPRETTFAAYELIFSQPNVVLNAYKVTILVTLFGTIGGLLVSTGLAYVTVRKDYRYRNITSFIVFFTILFHGGLVPYYIIIARWLGLTDTYLAMILPYLVTPIFVLFLKGFLQSLPIELYDSAKIDGASELRTFFQIVLPLSKPGLATVGLFFALRYWNDWFLALLFIEDFDRTPLQLMLVRIMQNVQFLRENAANLQGVVLRLEDLPSESLRMATLVVAAGPMLFVFPFFQRYFVRGLTVGSIKG
jgi:putative aldouronate transport system permease protein